jgi:hypothetical protein
MVKNKMERAIVICSFQLITVKETKGHKSLREENL